MESQLLSDPNKYLQVSWRTKDGRTLLPADFDNSHLQNTIGWIQTHLVDRTVVSATGYWAWHSKSLEDAAAVLKTETERGNQALREGDFAAAASAFAKAAKSVDTLGRDDVTARYVAHMSREATAASRESGRHPPGA